MCVKKLVKHSWGKINAEKWNCIYDLKFELSEFWIETHCLYADLKLRIVCKFDYFQRISSTESWWIKSDLGYRLKLLEYRRLKCLSR